MTVVVTHNVSPRMRGFLASSMLELAPGVYSTPGMSPAVRERLRTVVEDWFQVEEDASVVMVWRDSTIPGGQNVWVLGLPPVELVKLDGMVVSRRGGVDDSAH